MNIPHLSIGFSPCPNDTFIFNAMAHDKVKVPVFALQKEVLADVETLNNWAMAARLDISKVSFHALGHIMDDYVLLRAGSALGRGCGPLIMRLDAGALPRDAKIAVPGRYTTAALLFRMAYPAHQNMVNMPFAEIMPAVVRHEVDAGVVIHEGRFTYQEYGLTATLDLGAWWEETTGLPVPLGGIVARRALGATVLRAIEAAIAESLAWANDNKNLCLPYIMAHAQELDEGVIARHIALYVNDYSTDLGENGVAAVREFLRRGNEAGVFNCEPGNIILSDVSPH